MDNFIVVLGIRKGNNLLSLDNKLYKITHQFDTIDKGFYLLCKIKHKKDYYRLISYVPITTNQYNKIAKETLSQ